MRLNIPFRSALFDAQTIQRRLGHFQSILESVVANPGISLRDIPMLTAVEQKELAENWNQTGRDYSHTASVHQL